MGNQHYWVNKVELSKRAISHTNLMKKVYKDDIQKCINNSIIWSAEPGLKTVTFEKDGQLNVFDTSKKFNEKPSTFELVQETTDGALRNITGKTVLLNFASYKNPGGGFLAGSNAQEESLCHNSFLYNVLKELTGYYTWNNLTRNKGLYNHRAVYTPDVKFFSENDSTFVADVITCAAPNKSVADRYHSFSDEENNNVLKERIAFVKTVAQYSGDCDNIVLGAWGCGVFHQDPNIVSEYFMNEFMNSTFDTVIFAIPGGENYKAFKNALEKKS